MIITVASGKGGTGKTTVAVSLALSLTTDARNTRIPTNPLMSCNPLYLDCDVEEPNAALFLKPVFEQREEVGILIPEIDFNKCTYCGRCAEVCPEGAIEMTREFELSSDDIHDDMIGEYHIFMGPCERCGRCYQPPTALDRLMKPGMRNDEIDRKCPIACSTEDDE